MKRCFKLYPWEWMADESPAGCLADVTWVEPVWKLVMSNKAILCTLFELFPDSPYVFALLPVPSPVWLILQEACLFTRRT